MALAEVIYQHSLSMPEAAAREVLDFIEFLEQRHGQSTTLVSDDKNRQAALAHIAAVSVHWQENKPIPNRNALYDSEKSDALYFMPA